MENEDEGWSWAVVEIFGHRRHAGRVREEEKFGTKLLRVDVPTAIEKSPTGWTTHYYGGASIFSFTPTDQETVYRMNKPIVAASLTHWPSREMPDDPEMPF